MAAIEVENANQIALNQAESEDEQENDDPENYGLSEKSKFRNIFNIVTLK